MRLPRFDYFEPQTIGEACALLSRPGAKALAGGTELLVGMKQRTLEPAAVVNIKRIPGLDRIEQIGGGGLSLGPTVTLRAIATSPVVKDRFGLLAQAAASVGRPRIPYMGTIGGNICLDSRCFYFNQSRLWKQSLPRCHKDGGEVCHLVKGSDHCRALFVADTAPALIALGATVAVTDAAGETRMALEDFYTGKGEQANGLRPGQMLTQVRIPAPPPWSGGAYLRYSPREAIDFAVAGVGVLLTLSPDGETCREAKIVLGSVGSGPLQVKTAEAALRGRAVDEELLDEVAGLAAKEAHPITHLGVSAAYKRRIIQALTKRAVRQAWEQAAAGGDRRAQSRREGV